MTTFSTSAGLKRETEREACLFRTLSHSLQLSERGRMTLGLCSMFTSTQSGRPFYPEVIGGKWRMNLPHDYLLCLERRHAS